TLDVAWKEFDAGEQATHAAHVVITIAADFIGETVKDEHAVLERLQGRQDFLEFEIRADFVWPIGGWNGSIGAEHDDKALSRAHGAGQAEAGKPEQKRQGGGGDAE